MFTWRLKTPLLCSLLILSLVMRAAALQVNIDYSFYLPEELGKGAVETVGCCPYGVLPDKNNTESLMVPTVLGIGTQKSGTTTLFEHLKRHPQLLDSMKELYYLSNAGDETYEHYLKHWKINTDGKESIKDDEGNVQEIKALFEVTPEYIYVPFTACKIKDAIPQAKLIVFLRDPVDRAYSAFSFTNYVVYRDEKKKTRWMRQSFWYQVQHALLEIEENPECDFRTGAGNYSYNDCAKCMLRWDDVRESCEYRPFVTLTDKEGSFECTSVGRELIQKGMYAAQLAWWFTLFDPAQFKIVDFDTFTEKPLEVMQGIGKFLELQPPYTKEFLEKSMDKVNVGDYAGDDDPADVQKTKDFLREYYKRPNLELYRLLHETGHRGFRPFEDYLRKRDYLDCKDPKTIATGMCGDVKARGENSAQADQDALKAEGELFTPSFASVPQTTRLNSLLVPFILLGFCAVLAYTLRKFIFPRPQHLGSRKDSVPHRDLKVDRTLELLVSAQFQAFLGLGESNYRLLPL